MRNLFSCAALALTVLLFSSRSAAHDFSPGVLVLTEETPGRFRISWTEPVDSTGESSQVQPRYPEQCRKSGAVLDCDPPGLVGEVHFDGMTTPGLSVVVIVKRESGATAEQVATSDQPQVALALGQRSWAWVGLGAEHLLVGYDHLAFLAGLLLLTGFGRRALLAVTAFTLAHSVTLALASLGWVSLRAPPVEACIAASVVLVAREALHDTTTLARRAPWLLAGAFGLVHGLGFAGVLAQRGLTREALAWPLFGFNLGLELAQLSVVLVLFVVVRALSRWLPSRSRLVACYALGSLGAWWFLSRAAAMFVS